MTQPTVGLWVTCLVDFFRPQVALASVRLLEAAGCRVEVPSGQTCCGQPAWNAGDRATARALGEQLLDQCRGLEALVVPSGSCTGMIRQLPDVLGTAHPRHGEALALAERTHELAQYLVDVLDYRPLASCRGLQLTYHDACSGLRELGVRGQPRRLLADAGVELVEMDQATVCCGFGGTFCVKYPEISAGMVDDKLASIERSGARCVAAGDLGCLLNIQGRLQRQERAVQARHFVEWLADGLADGLADDATRAPAGPAAGDQP